MKLSFSNIAWPAKYDTKMYGFLQNQGFSGLEIAPSRIFPDKPYEHITEARRFAKNLREQYGLVVSSMQSIWYGRTENIFGSDADRLALIGCTRKAIDFAVSIDCANLVFGCPKNRNIPNGIDTDKARKIAHSFLEEIGFLARQSGVVIAVEPNPMIYGTNFINRTEEAFELARFIDGIKVNIDSGALIENGEELQIIADNIALVNHVHISEPNLVLLERRGLHGELSDLFKEYHYNNYVSVEMKTLADIELVKGTALYISEVFG